MKYLIIVPLLLIASVALAWEKDCSSGQCRIYTYTDVSQNGLSEPVRMFLEVTASNNVILTALNTRTYHERFYSTKPPTYVRLNQKDYVPVMTYLNERFPGNLTVDGKQIAPLPVRNESQLKSQSADFGTIAKAFKRGTSATTNYVSFLFGRENVSFSLIGFTKMYASLSPTIASPDQAVSTKIDPISVLSPLLNGNRFSVRVSDLSIKQNPYGSGAFVYVPKTKYFDVERLFVWFVRDNTAIKLNGATHHLTPSLPFPLDVSLDLWEDTGLSSKNVTQIGLKVAFGS